MSGYSAKEEEKKESRLKRAEKELRGKCNLKELFYTCSTPRAWLRDVH